MILVLALSCFVFGCAYHYILGVPDQVAEIAGIDFIAGQPMMASTACAMPSARRY